MESIERYDVMAVIMKAMAHPTRLFILDKLNEKEHCVCELQEMIGVDMSTVSKHLSVLKNAGIVSTRKHNNQVYYSLLCPCIMDVFECIIDVKKSNKEYFR